MAYEGAPTVSTWVRSRNPHPCSSGVAVCHTTRAPTSPIDCPPRLPAAPPRQEGFSLAGSQRAYPFGMASLADAGQRCDQPEVGPGAQVAPIAGRARPATLRDAEAIHVAAC
jgi:hypothetical protein